MKCLNHSFFWDDEKKLSFICDLSDKIEYEIALNEQSRNSMECFLVQRLESMSIEMDILIHNRWDNLFHAELVF